MHSYNVCMNVCTGWKTEYIIPYFWRGDTLVTQYHHEKPDGPHSSEAHTHIQEPNGKREDSERVNVNWHYLFCCCINAVL